MPNYDSLAKSVKFATDKKHTLIASDSSLTLIGTGRSAYVFRIHDTDLAMKVFFPTHVKVATIEADIYRAVQNIEYYPTLHEAGDDYLVIDYIDGRTLFEQLTLGISVTEDTIHEIDHALNLARLLGLNPSDIHLRNILITSNNTVKIIDLARFRQTKSCKQWQDLKRVFHLLYKRCLIPKKIPAFILDLIAAIYKKRFLQPLLGDRAQKVS